MSMLRNGVPWAGLACGPAAWAVSTQLNYALAGTGHGGVLTVPLIALSLALLTLGGGAMSWRAWRRTREPAGTQASGIPPTVLAGAGTLASILFAAVIVLQGIAGLIVR